MNDVSPSFISLMFFRIICRIFLLYRLAVGRVEFYVFLGFYPPLVFAYGFLVGYRRGWRDAVGSGLVVLMELLNQFRVSFSIRFRRAPLTRCPVNGFTLPESLATISI